MKTLKQFVDEASQTKVTLINRKFGDDEYETGADISYRGRPMEPPHRQDEIKKIPLNQTVRHEPEVKTNKETASPESEKKIKGIMADIKKKKEIDPITVRRKPSGSLRGKYQVMDGHHRLEAHLRMGLKHIPAVIIHPQNVKYDGIEEK